MAMAVDTLSSDPVETMVTVTMASSTSENLSGVWNIKAMLLIGCASVIRTTVPISPPIEEDIALIPSAWTPSPRFIRALPSMVLIAPEGAPGIFRVIPVIEPA